MFTMADIKFTVRKRKRKVEDFWSVEYRNDGTITKISPGRQLDNPRSLNVSYSKIEKILRGKDSQSNYIVAINDKIGALDLVNKRSSYKIEEEWNAWHSVSLYEKNDNAELKFVLFSDKGIVRLEPNRIWTTSALENKLSEPIKLYITDSTDPHIFLGNINIKMQSLLEKGYAEFSMWDIIDPLVIDDIKNKDRNIRLNFPKNSKGIVFVKAEKYYSFNGTSELQTIISHPGPGTHITLYVKNNTVWAQSHYTPGCPIDDVTGTLKGALVKGDDPDCFVDWVEFPALMLRQDSPFEVSFNWPDNTPINLLYKANNLDIGVVA